MVMLSAGANYIILLGEGQGIRKRKGSTEPQGRESYRQLRPLHSLPHPEGHGAAQD